MYFFFKNEPNFYSSSIFNHQLQKYILRFSFLFFSFVNCWRTKESWPHWAFVQLNVTDFNLKWKRKEPIPVHE